MILLSDLGDLRTGRVAEIAVPVWTSFRAGCNELLASTPWSRPVETVSVVVADKAFSKVFRVPRSVSVPVLLRSDAIDVWRGSRGAGLVDEAVSRFKGGRSEEPGKGLGELSSSICCCDKCGIGARGVAFAFREGDKSLSVGVRVATSLELDRGRTSIADSARRRSGVTVADLLVVE